MRIIHRYFALVVLTALATGCGGGADEKGKSDAEVVVFAAASLRESLEELGRAFEEGGGAHVAFNFAGSNDLAHQIGAARGMDLFLSASEAWMDTVQSAGRLVRGTRRDLLANSLVVVAHPGAGWTALDSACALAALPFEHLAMGDPEAVPAGTYARRWMRSVHCGGAPLWDAVQARVAPTPDVRAAVGLVLADPKVAGAVYRTDWMAFRDRLRVLHEVKDGPPIRYVLAQVAEGDAPEAARRFHAYLSGSQAAQVFANHGFVPISSPATAAP